MVSLNIITNFLNKELGLSRIDDSKNGLQVRGKTDVNKMGFAVDACMDVFEKAKNKKCDLIIVHHGLIWEGVKDIMGRRKELINFLKKNNISLYASHHPLDINSKYGNNVELAAIVGAKNLKKFGSIHKLTWGWQAKINSTSLKSILTKYNKALNTKCRLLNFGKKKINSIGFVSGGGAFCIEEAKKKNLDLVIVGEIHHIHYNLIKELKLNFIVAGHYKSETVGVKALMRILKQKFNIKTEFIDAPTGL